MIWQLLLSSNETLLDVYLDVRVAQKFNIKSAVKINADDKKDSSLLDNFLLNLFIYFEDPCAPTASKSSKRQPLTISIDYRSCKIIQFDGAFEWHPKRFFLFFSLQTSIRQPDSPLRKRVFVAAARVKCFVREEDVQFRETFMHFHSICTNYASSFLCLQIFGQFADWNERGLHFEAQRLVSVSWSEFLKFKFNFCLILSSVFFRGWCLNFKLSYFLL